MARFLLALATAAVLSVAGAGTATARTLDGADGLRAAPGDDAKVLKVLGDYAERTGDFDPDDLDLDLLSQIAEEIGVDVDDVTVKVTDVLDDAAVQRTSARYGDGPGHGHGGRKGSGDRSHNNNIVGDLLNGDILNKNDILNDVLNNNNINLSDVVHIGGSDGGPSQEQNQDW